MIRRHGNVGNLDEQVARQKYHALVAGRQPVTEDATADAVLFQAINESFAVTLTYGATAARSPVSVANSVTVSVRIWRTVERSAGGN